MTEQLHSFHIPVMGTGHSADTPIRVAPLGISSVISLVDDFLLEKLRRHYSEKHNVPYSEIPRNESDGRAKRITAYLELVRHLVHEKVEAIKRQPFFQQNEKQTYFDLLPDESSLKQEYLELKRMPEGTQKDSVAETLSSKMRPGAIDVNIMVKLDRVNYDRSGQSLGDEFTDAKAALRGFANSCLQSSVVFSAGLNPRLYSYLSRFNDFYRDAYGQIRKKIIVKVSDFRSALVQGKFLAKHGLEVSEYRVESGLNCGGHAFPAQGQLVPLILKEFKEKWSQLTAGFHSLVEDYYKKKGWSLPATRQSHPELTVQGGIGTAGEASRLKKEFGVSRTGWGSPFLLVPEVTNVDDATRELLCQAKEKDLYLSDVSPLGIPFNTVRGTGSETWTEERAARGRPGSPCPNGFAVTNTEFTERPICVASRLYQKKKWEEIDKRAISENEKDALKKEVVKKTCICFHLGNGILTKLGITKENSAPPMICPGPNIAWFDRTYTLKEMVDHIYGRGPTLVPSERPHMFAKEIIMNVDYFEKLTDSLHGKPQDVEKMTEYKTNLDNGMSLCLEISKQVSFQGENLVSLAVVVREQQNRLNSLFSHFMSRSKEVLN